MSFYRNNFKLLLGLSFFSIIIDFLNSNFLKLYSLFAELKEVNTYLLFSNKFINFIKKIGEISIIATIFITIFETTYRKKLISNTKKFN